MGYGQFKQKFSPALRANPDCRRGPSRPIMTFVGAVAELAKIGVSYPEIIARSSPLSKKMSHTREFFRARRISAESVAFAGSGHSPSSDARSSERPLVGVARIGSRDTTPRRLRGNLLYATLVAVTRRHLGLCARKDRSRSERELTRGTPVKSRKIAAISIKRLVAVGIAAAITQPSAADVLYTYQTSALNPFRVGNGETDFFSVAFLSPFMLAPNSYYDISLSNSASFISS